MGFHNPKRQCGIDLRVFCVQNPSLMLSEVAMFKTTGDQRSENAGNYHNPTRQRGIFRNTLETQKCNPSLTRRVVIVANAQLQN